MTPSMNEKSQLEHSISAEKGGLKQFYEEQLQLVLKGENRSIYGHGRMKTNRTSVRQVVL